MDAPTIKILEIYRTCLACPSQWEGKTDDGQVVYIRYRHGYLRVGVGATLMDAVRANPIFGLDHGGMFDGFMEYDELKKLLPAAIKLPPVEANADGEDPFSKDSWRPYSFGT